MSEIRPGPLTVLSKLPARVRARGFREVADLITHRIKEELHSEDRLIFFVRPTGAGEEPSSLKTEGLRLIRARPEHGELYERDIGTDSASTFRGRLSDGTRCYIVVEGERALHATWVTTSSSWVRELRRYFRPPAGSAYVYESFTRADARGRGVYPFALRGICTDLGNDGLEQVWVAVEADNPPSLKAVRKADFEEAFEISYQRRWGRITVSEPRGPGADLCPDCFLKKLEE
ncbi:MAG TPA: hypothetical protein VEV82_08680 [Actinomycetota bacterium]|nr:hypothetical protein [Actinomycetota bacterium]